MVLVLALSALLVSMGALAVAFSTRRTARRRAQDISSDHPRMVLLVREVEAFLSLATEEARARAAATDATQREALSTRFAQERAALEAAFAHEHRRLNDLGATPNTWG